MENKEMTDHQFDTILKTVIRILELDEKEKAIEYLKSLIKEK